MEFGSLTFLSPSPLKFRGLITLDGLVQNSSGENFQVEIFPVIVSLTIAFKLLVKKYLISVIS